MQGSEIRSRRILARISGDILCRAVPGLSRTRLSGIERGYVPLNDDEAERISAALEGLTAAKARVDAVAAEVGWPVIGAPVALVEGVA